MSRPPRYGDYSPEYLIGFYERLPLVCWTMTRMVNLLNRFPREILELADDFGFEYNPEHPEFTSEQAIAMIEEWNQLAKSKGKKIDLGMQAVSAELSPDGQSRVIIKLLGQKRLFDEANDRNVYVRGVVKRNSGHPGTTRSQEIGLLLAGLPGANRVQFRRNEGAFVDVDIDHPHLIPHLKRIACKLVELADAHSESA